MVKLNLQEFFAAEFAEHATVVAMTEEALYEPFCHLLEVSARAIREGRKLLFFGNGGSASDAQHLATELTVRFSKNRKAIAAIALTTDTSALTAIGNDLGFDQIFVRQIEALGKAGDVAIGISTSGQSANVLLALKQAKQMGLVTAALSGKDGGRLLGLADPLLIVPSDRTARIQELHITLGQMLCSALEQELGLV